MMGAFHEWCVCGKICFKKKVRERERERERDIIKKSNTGASHKVRVRGEIIK